MHLELDGRVVLHNVETSLVYDVRYLLLRQRTTEKFRDFSHRFFRLLRQHINHT